MQRSWGRNALACLRTSKEQPVWLRKSEKGRTLEVRARGICHRVLEGLGFLSEWDVTSAGVLSRGVM